MIAPTSNLRFLGIREVGRGRVAEFNNWQPGDFVPSLRLGKKSLESRIANLQKAGADVSVETAALAALNEKLASQQGG